MKSVANKTCVNSVACDAGEGLAGRLILPAKGGGEPREAWWRGKTPQREARRSSAMIFPSFGSEPGAARDQTNSRRSSRPTAFAARMRVSSVVPLLSGSSSRSSWARLVCISAAMRDLLSPRSFIAAAIWSAITLLIAAAVTSSRKPFSSSQLSNVEPTCAFLAGLSRSIIGGIVPSSVHRARRDGRAFILAAPAERGLANALPKNSSGKILKRQLGEEQVGAFGLGAGRPWLGDDWRGS